jgi:hypothetical protein
MRRRETMPTVLPRIGACLIALGCKPQRFTSGRHLPDDGVPSQAWRMPSIRSPMRSTPRGFCGSCSATSESGPPPSPPTTRKRARAGPPIRGRFWPSGRRPAWARQQVPIHDPPSRPRPCGSSERSAPSPAVRPWLMPRRHPAPRRLKARRVGRRRPAAARPRPSSSRQPCASSSRNADPANRPRGGPPDNGAT